MAQDRVRIYHKLRLQARAHCILPSFDCTHDKVLSKSQRLHWRLSIYRVLKWSLIIVRLAMECAFHVALYVFCYVQSGFCHRDFTAIAVMGSPPT